MPMSRHSACAAPCPRVLDHPSLRRLGAQVADSGAPRSVRCGSCYVRERQLWAGGRCDAAQSPIRWFLSAMNAIERRRNSR